MCVSKKFAETIQKYCGLRNINCENSIDINYATDKYCFHFRLDELKF